MRSSCCRDDLGLPMLLSVRAIENNLQAVGPESRITTAPADESELWPTEGERWCTVDAREVGKFTVKWRLLRPPKPKLGGLACDGSLHDAYAIICIKALLITQPSDDHQPRRLYPTQVP